MSTQELRAAEPVPAPYARLRDRTKPSLAGSGTLFQRLLEAAADGIVAVDEGGLIVLANAEAERIFGYGPDELIGRSIETLVPEPRRMAHFRHRRAYFASSHSRPMGFERGELAGQRKDGSTFPAEISLSPVETGAGPMVISVVRDVAARKRTEAERALAAIVQSSNDAVIGKTLEGIVTSWNPAAERLYGYTAAEMVGQSILRIVPNERADELPPIFERLRRGQRVDHFETTRVAKDGRRLDVSVSISPVVDATGQVLGAATIARDVTARKRAEAERRFLAEAGALLVASVDIEATLARVAALAVPGLADWCVVHELEAGGTLRRLAVAHADPALAALVGEASDPGPLDPDAPSGPVRVIVSGRAELAAEVPDGVWESVTRDAAQRRRLRAGGTRSYLSVPLRARERVLGAITLIGAAAGRHYGPDDLTMAGELAQRVALALDNRRLYERLTACEQQTRGFAGGSDRPAAGEAEPATPPTDP